MYKKRKLWNKVAEKAIHLSGIHTQSLGKDDDKREYWKFPNCDFIFISDASASAWKVITTTEQVQEIIDKLGCSTAEHALAQNLIDFINDRNFFPSSTSLIVVPNKSNEESSDDKAEVMEENNDNEDEDGDKDPFELKLLESKGLTLVFIHSFMIITNIIISGQPIFKTYTIPDESVFVDDSNTIDEEDPYLMYEKKAKYYAIALLNKKGRIVKLPRGIVTIRYLIHKDDGKLLVGDVPLDEQWHSDNLYYFAVPVFKRSGNYTGILIFKQLLHFIITFIKINSFVHC